MSLQVSACVRRWAPPASLVKLILLFHSVCNFCQAVAEVEVSCPSRAFQVGLTLPYLRSKTLIRKERASTRRLCRRITSELPSRCDVHARWIDRSIGAWCRKYSRHREYGSEAGVRLCFGSANVNPRRQDPAGRYGIDSELQLIQSFRNCRRMLRCSGLDCTLA